MENMIDTKNRNIMLNFPMVGIWLETNSKKYGNDVIAPSRHIRNEYIKKRMKNL